MLLGNHPLQNTVEGDPNRDESDIKAISTYLNRRVWSIPDNVDVRVAELRSANPDSWPRSEAQALGRDPSLDAKTRDQLRLNRRVIEGARRFIYTPGSDGKVGAHGEVPLRDGAVVEWALWEGERPRVQSYASIGSYIAALYDGELFDIHPSSELWMYRTFGVVPASVRSKLWLILRPPIADDRNPRPIGVYPNASRSTLLQRGGPYAGSPLPWGDWGAEFAENMPRELQNALHEAQLPPVSEGDTLSEEDKRRLLERFGKRWRVPKRRVAPNGTTTVTPVQPGTRPRGPRPVVIKPRPPRPPSTTGTAGTQDQQLILGTTDGPFAANEVKSGADLPNVRWAHESDFDPGMLAQYVPNDAGNGPTIVLNMDHPVVLAQIAHWQEGRPDYAANAIANLVMNVFATEAQAKVAHSEHMRSLVGEQDIRAMRTTQALTIALLGLVDNDAMVGPRMNSITPRRRQGSSSSPQAASQGADGVVADPDQLPRDAAAAPRASSGAREE